MSKPKAKPPYLLQVANADQAALLSELFQKAAVTAPQAHILAAMWANVQLCTKHFTDSP